MMTHDGITASSSRHDDIVVARMLHHLDNVVLHAHPRAAHRAAAGVRRAPRR
eukprot:CAMPEP_0173427678 /NCGR_PEP_ID=MMETSP1357-20121228/6823_1 /TAXON_ID=77926 /ORGANISM="Hemiselmis rufescens, Strain PCC563" /LENGTH=51 /DNA_ID=CAMNT_0014391563 /DNA_START=270 /DNA_END=421 /DNA_ORIENTATION=+